MKHYPDRRHSQRVRLIRVLIPEEKYATVGGALREKDFEVVTSRAYDDAGESAGSWLLELAVPNAAVEEVFGVLNESGVDEEAYTVVMEAEAVATPRSEMLRDRYSGDYAPLTWAELRAKAQDLSTNRYSYAGLMVLSAVIATAALLLDSPAVLVGSMVIAPLVSPVITAAVGAITGDRGMFTKSIGRQLGGVVIAVAAATLTGLGFQALSVVPTPLALPTIELFSLRLSPSVIALVVGVASGAAGAVAFVTRGTTELVGVMIAAALVPAAAAVGIGIAWGNRSVILGTSALLLATLVLINAGMAGTIALLGYRPRGSAEMLSRRPAALAIGVSLLVVVATVAGVGGHVAYATTAKGAVEDVVEQPRFAALEVVSIGVQYAGPGANAPATVSVLLSHPASASVNESAVSSALSRRIAAETDRPTAVDLQVETHYRSGAVPNGSDGAARFSPLDRLGQGMNGHDRRGVAP